MTRLMTKALAAALDDLTPVERTTLKRIAGEGGTPWLRRLLLALRVELIVQEQREGEVLHDLEADHQADVDKLAEGADWSHVAPPAPRTVAWFPEAAPDTIEGVET